MSAVFQRRRGAVPSSFVAEFEPRPASRPPSMAGWHESTLDLLRGLEVVEHDLLDDWQAAWRDDRDAAAS